MSDISSFIKKRRRSTHAYVDLEIFELYKAGENKKSKI